MDPIACNQDWLDRMIGYQASRFDSSIIYDVSEGAICFDHSDLYLKHTQGSSEYARLRIEFEHCIEADASRETCMDQQTAEDRWQITQIYLQSEYKQIDLKN